MQKINNLDWVEGVQSALSLINFNVAAESFVENAAKNGRMRLLVWFLKTCHESFLLKALSTSIKNGHEMQSLVLCRMMWRTSRYQHNYEWPMCEFARAGFLRGIMVVCKVFRSYQYFINDAFVVASENGKIRMMKLLAKSASKLRQNINWKAALYRAVASGDMGSIRFAHKMGAHITDHTLSVAWWCPKIQNLLQKLLKKRPQTQQI